MGWVATSALPQSVVLLHGFGGTRRAWDAVVRQLDRSRLQPLALDLPGHGGCPAGGRPITFSGCVEHVLARCPESFALCGYSMGGRVALHVALAAPRRVGRLVLVATTAGIEEGEVRARRRAHDRLLADELERVRFEEFIERWRRQPLFAHDPPRVDALARADQRRNRPRELAAVLRGIGSGEMEPLWARLAQLTMPTSVVVGERDLKFRRLGARMVELLPEGELIVLPGGHGLPLESPAALAAVLQARPRGDR
jgi:2-succinyl-6-hydroxy-2,4-cyclohexadiene-1-carboxylate synthase